MFLIGLTISSHASRTTSEPGTVAAEKSVRRRVHEDVTIRALVNRNEVSIVGRQYVLSPVENDAHIVLFRAPLAILKSVLVA